MTATTTKRITPYERIKAQLDEKQRECDNLQEANAGLSSSLQIERAALRVAQDMIRTFEQRVRLQSAVQIALVGLVNVLDVPWFNRSRQRIDAQRAVLHAAYRDIDNFAEHQHQRYLDPRAGKPDEPGNIAGLQTRGAANAYSQPSPPVGVTGGDKSQGIFG